MGTTHARVARGVGTPSSDGWPHSAHATVPMGLSWSGRAVEALCPRARCMLRVGGRHQLCHRTPQWRHIQDKAYGSRWSHSSPVSEGGVPSAARATLCHQGCTVLHERSRHCLLYEVLPTDPWEAVVRAFGRHCRGWACEVGPVLLSVRAAELAWAGNGVVIGFGHSPTQPRQCTGRH